MKLFTMVKKIITFLIVINMNKDIKKQLNYNDSTITENHALINRIKNDHLLKKHAQKLLNDE